MKATEIIGQHERLRSKRSGFDTTYQQVAQRIIPRKALFNRKDTANVSRGEKKTFAMFDAVPALALDRFAAAVHSLVVPRNQVWHKVKSPIEELNKNVVVQRYFERVNDTLFAARYAGNFDNQVHECFFDLGAFATMILFIGDTGTKLYYKAIPLWQVFMEENPFGIVDLVSREFYLTARQAVAEYGADNLPSVIVRAADKSPELEFEFVSLCMANPERDVNRQDFRGMAYAQWDVSLTGTQIVKQEGYRAFPYAVNRYSTTPGEVYGRGPAEIVLPDINMLNSMNKTTMQAAELRALPPLLAGSSGILDTIRLSPGAVNYGGIDDQGRQKIIPMQSGGDLGVSIEMMDQKRRVIQDAFWNTLFLILVDSPTMTATEAMLRAQEKGALLAPTASRIESEFLETAIARELSILAMRGVLPEPPQELIEAGSGYEIQYDSPMSRARMAEKGIGMLRTWEQLAPAAEVVGPSVFDRFNWTESTKILAEVNGYPAEAMYSDEEMEERAAEKQQAAQMQQILEAAPVAASAAKDLAAAQSLAGAAPNQVAPGLFG